MGSCDLTSLSKAISWDFCSMLLPPLKFLTLHSCMGCWYSWHKSPIWDLFLIAKHPMEYYTPKGTLTMIEWGMMKYGTILFQGFFFFNDWALSACTLLWWVSKFANAITAWKFQILLNGSVVRGYSPEVPEMCPDLLHVTTLNSDPHNW